MTRASILEQRRHSLPHLGVGRRRYHQQQEDEQFIALSSTGIALGRGCNDEPSKMKRVCRDAINRVHLEPVPGRDQLSPYILFPESLVHVNHIYPTSKGRTKLPTPSNTLIN